ncbi:hypothetical protein VHA_001604 [Grimontia hollisae CIP 101886]|uniref:Uncharacterized protein n=1 Tax=Grimontia hollisae CIP 101886 TaxID=675812 RepID=D0I782_GRIHO|nr:hypothetical protein VHA_001604 [Grimontia hollisae CIP 101886]
MEIDTPCQPSDLARLLRFHPQPDNILLPVTTPAKIKKSPEGPIPSIIDWEAVYQSGRAN